MFFLSRIFNKITNVYPTEISGKWAYEIYGCMMDAPDDFVISKYILHRLSERHNVMISWHVSPSLGLPLGQIQLRFAFSLENNNLQKLVLERGLNILKSNFKIYVFEFKRILKYSIFTTILIKSTQALILNFKELVLIFVMYLFINIKFVQKKIHKLIRAKMS